MALSVLEHLKPEYILFDLKAGTETEAIEEVANVLKDDPRIHDFAAFREELFSREKLSPTALGSGVAFPHARTDQVSEIVIAAGRSREGVWFKKSEEKVHLIFVIGTPTRSVRDYLRLIASLAALLRHPAGREKLMQAQTAGQFLAVLNA